MRIKSRSDYFEYLKSKNWKRKRRLVFRKKGRVCFVCGGRAWNVHHKNYNRLGNERLSDLEPVCELCHKRIHIN
jgi:5-methylcytosine-specific restriction endonuclease McrA